MQSRVQLTVAAAVESMPAVALTRAAWDRRDAAEAGEGGLAAEAPHVTGMGDDPGGDLGTGVMQVGKRVTVFGQQLGHLRLELADPFVQGGDLAGPVPVNENETLRPNLVSNLLGVGQSRLWAPSVSASSPTSARPPDLRWSVESIPESGRPSSDGEAEQKSRRGGVVATILSLTSVEFSGGVVGSNRWSGMFNQHFTCMN